MGIKYGERRKARKCPECGRAIRENNKSGLCNYHMVQKSQKNRGRKNGSRKIKH